MGEIIDVYGDAIKVFFGVALAGGLNGRLRLPLWTDNYKCIYGITRLIKREKEE